MASSVKGSPVYLCHVGYRTDCFVQVKLVTDVTLNFRVSGINTVAWMVLRDGDRDELTIGAPTCEYG